MQDGPSPCETETLANATFACISACLGLGLVVLLASSSTILNTLQIKETRTFLGGESLGNRLILMPYYTKCGLTKSHLWQPCLSEMVLLNYNHYFLTSVKGFRQLLALCICQCLWWVISSCIWERTRWDRKSVTPGVQQQDLVPKWLLLWNLDEATLSCRPELIQNEKVWWFQVIFLPCFCLQMLF